LKLLKSAIANAKHNFGLDEKNLYIQKSLLMKDQKWKRFFQGLGEEQTLSKRKSSHVTLILKEKEKT
jgi:large subunit ribosomal protein L22